jgi:hypothetical protein
MSKSKYSVEVSDKITYLRERLVEVKKTDEDVRLVKELFPDMHIWLDKDVNCAFQAKSMNEVKNILKIFAKNGVMLDHFNESESSPIWYLKGKNVFICLTPVWSDEKTEGATCRLVQVGETTVTYPKYKLVCDE